MISLDRASYQVQPRYAEYAGLSTDVKPVESIDNGDEFQEIDTGFVYKFNAETSQWVQQPAGGGGGGTSNYNDLINKPQINGVTLTGNKTTKQLGIDIPTKLPNPFALTFTGAVTAEYDGSGTISVEIPESSAGTSEIVLDTTLKSNASVFTATFQPASKVKVVIFTPAGTSGDYVYFRWYYEGDSVYDYTITDVNTPSTSMSVWSANLTLGGGVATVDFMTGRNPGVSINGPALNNIERAGGNFLPKYKSASLQGEVPEKITRIDVETYGSAVFPSGSRCVVSVEV